MVELVIVIVITGILMTVAMRAGVTISRTARVEETRQKLEAVEFAIAGNPALNNNGVRSDFGYVGDIGTLPPNLNALHANPAGYSTWKGPYIKGRFTQLPDDYSRDAWNVPLLYSGGTTITSTGSGSNIVRSFANSASDLLINRVTGTVCDLSGTPPTAIYEDSVVLRLTVPNGLGGMTIRQRTPDASGFFFFDSVPVGNHDFQAIFRPTADTLRRFVSVAPRSTIYSELRFASNLWSPAIGLTLVPGSDTVTGSPPCTNVSFWVLNNTGVSRTISNMTVSWPAPSAYYGQIIWNGNLVFDRVGSPRGESGVSYTLTLPQAVAAGQAIRVEVADFRASNTYGGASPASMSGVSLTVQLSDGTTFVEVFPPCP